MNRSTELHRLITTLIQGPSSQFIFVESNQVSDDIKMIHEVYGCDEYSFEYNLGNGGDHEFISKIAATCPNAFVLTISNLNRDVIIKLNYLREELFQLKKKIIIVLAIDSEKILDFIEYAPDLYMWKSGPYTLTN